MKATRKRPRKLDPLASRAAVKNIIARLRSEAPELIPSSDKELLSLLRAVVHAERNPAVKARHGRKSRWTPANLERTGRAMRTVLARETKPVALRSFVEHYLFILVFPDDVARTLEAGEINLFEAEQLARLTPTRLEMPEAKLKKQRQALLRTHLQMGESGFRLKARVDAMLQPNRNRMSSVESISPKSTVHSAEILAAAAQLEAELDQEAENNLDISGIKPDHLFYEYLNLIVSLMKEIRPKELSDKAIERLSSTSEQLIHQLSQIHKEQNPPLETKGLPQPVTTFHL